MIELHIFRKTQADSLTCAMEDGSLYFIGTFSDSNMVDQIKDIIEITVDCMDSDEEIVFVEVK